MNTMSKKFARLEGWQKTETAMFLRWFNLLMWLRKQMAKCSTCFVFLAHYVNIHSFTNALILSYDKQECRIETRQHTPPERRRTSNTTETKCCERRMHVLEPNIIVFIIHYFISFFTVTTSIKITCQRAHLHARMFINILWQHIDFRACFHSSQQ